jgi:bifunctional enzyme Fae/Hps
MENAKLVEPPYLQIAFDAPDINVVKRIISELPKTSRIILEAGTPLIKKYGIGVVGEIKNSAKRFVIADLKTLDVGGLEARMAAEAGADAAVVSGLAAFETISEFISESHKHKMYAIIDMMNVKEKAKLIGSLVELPDIVILHRGIDTEKSKVGHSFDVLEKVKKEFGDRLLIAIAGGIKTDSAKKAIENGADIVIVGRYITEASNARKTVDEFLNILR